MRRMTLAAILAATLLLTLGGGPVGADPTNGRNSRLITLTCNGTPVTIVVSGNGSAAHLVDSTGVLIPVAFQITGTFTDPETGEQIPVNESFTIGQGERVGQQGDLFTCTYPITDPGFTGTGTVTLFRVPRGE